MKMLHKGHPGVSTCICRMKSLARGVVWWPRLDTEFETKEKSCEACQVNSKSPPTCRSTLQPWEWPSNPGLRFMCPFSGKNNFCSGGCSLQMAESCSCFLHIFLAGHLSTQVSICSTWTPRGAHVSGGEREF